MTLETDWPLLLLLLLASCCLWVGGLMEITTKQMRAAGLTEAQILRLITTVEEDRAANRREQNRINKQNQRSRQHVSADIPPPPVSPVLPSSSPPYPPNNYPLSPSEPPPPMPMGGRFATNEVFEEFWKNYPKRDGSNPKHPAAQKFTAVLKSGVDAQIIIAAARSYRAECNEKKITGTPLVAQAKTWLNQQRWGDYTDPAKPKEPEAIPEQLERRRQMIEEGAKLRHAQKNGNGALGGDPEPGSPILVQNSNRIWPHA